MQDGMKPLKMLISSEQAKAAINLTPICATVSSASAWLFVHVVWQDEQKALETLMSKRSALQGKRTELERKIKDLGSLPSEAFEKWRDHSLQELHKLLQKANTQLKKFRCG